MSSRDPITEIAPFQTSGSVSPLFYWWYNNTLLIVQAGFSLFLAVFTATMLGLGRDATVYLPILTGVITLWLPTPLGHKITPPSQGPATALTRKPPTPTSLNHDDNINNV